MEPQTGFDLGAALERWRMELQDSPGLPRDDVRELETHLRDSVQALEAKGLSTAEAFCLAVRRLGTPRELAREFGKANPQRLWVERGLWLLVGFLTFEWVNACAMAIGLHLGNALLGRGVNPVWTFGVSQLLPVAIDVALLGLGWRWMSRRGTEPSPGLGSLLRRPWLLALGVVVLNVYRWPLLDALARGMDPVIDALLTLGLGWFHTGGGEVALGEPEALAAWRRWTGLAPLALALVAFVLLARQRLRLNATAGSETGADPGTQPGPATMQDVLALESIGLSREEAELLVRRRGIAADAPVTQALTSPRQVWTERGLWMLGGVVLSHGLLWPAQAIVEGLVWGVALLSVGGQAAGPLGLVIQCVVLWAALRLGWRGALRWEGTCRRWGHFVVQRPELSAVGALGLALGLEALAIGLGTFLAPILSTVPGSNGGALVHWYMGGQQLYFNVIPVAFAAVLAHRRWRESAASEARAS